MPNNKKQYTFTLPVGTILTGGQNSYHIEEVLGQGGYGITYKVWAIIKNGQIPVKVPFAIKEHFVNGRCHRAADGVTVEYSQEAAEDVEESLKDFVKEGRLLNKICQVSDEAVRYIVPVNEVIEVNNTAYFVMQYLEGGSLRRMVLNSGALPEEKALALIKPIVRAVDFIHRHKVLHMDIKPENIVMHRNLLTGQEEPVLIDFGVSLHFNKKGGLTSKHTSFGHTEGFSPIEQYGAVESFVPWIDVYALGATLYYLLAGKTPPKAFDMSPDDVDKSLPPEVSKRTKVAIKHAMTKDYHDRTQSASTFLWELENDYEPVVRKTPDSQKDVEDTNVTVKKKVVQTKGTNPPPPVSPTHKRKWIWLLVACFVVLLVVFRAIPNGTTDANQHEDVDTVHLKGIDFTPMVKDQVDTLASLSTDTIETKAVEQEKIWDKNRRYILYVYTGLVDKKTNLPTWYGYAAYLDGIRDFYEGEFVNGLRNDSTGKLKYKNGDIYEGSFENDHFAEGKYTIKEDGSYFIGSFQNDQPYNGTWFDSKGKQISKVRNGKE